MDGLCLSAVRWTALKALALCESVLFGCLLVLALFMIEAVFCIWSVKSIELVNAITYGGRSACQYPIDIYARPLRVLFTVVAPFALVLHVPVAYILDKPLYGWPEWTAFASRHVCRVPARDAALPIHRELNHGSVFC